MDISLTLADTSQIQWIIILLVVDVALGIIAALMKKEFRLGKLAGFMKKGVLGYVFGFVVLQSVLASMPSLAIVTTVAFILVALALVGSILSNLSKLGIPLPSWAKKE